MDQGFPQAILANVLARWTPELELLELAAVDPELTHGKDDWQVILGVHQLGFDGFVSLDTDMIALPEVVAIIEATNMSVVHIEDARNDPITATGLLLFHLRFIAKRHRPDRPQIWRLAARDKAPAKIDDIIEDLEARTGRNFSPFRSQAAQRRQTRVLPKRKATSQPKREGKRQLPQKG